MVNIISLFAFLLCSTLSASVEDYLKNISPKTEGHSFKNIDFIYLINLDERPEKLQHSMEQLAPYGIIPYRFSAVNGWTLPLTTINAIGTPYELSMGSGRWGTAYPIEYNGAPYDEIMQEPGKVYYAHCMSRGAIGIVLSHLSILKDAYDSGYETIWVFEDDIEVIQDPRIITDFIDELDNTVGKDGWDILFTDPDTKGGDGNYVACYSYAWRPHMPSIDLRRFSFHQDIGTNFRKVGARYGAYSMIVRRSGMKKLLDFFQERSLFLPFDMEYTLPAEINLFTLKQDVVSTMPKAPSDNGKPYYLEKK
jgi:GR25 family glycosyltransferase involved in LPS biosynthesis